MRSPIGWRRSSSAAPEPAEAQTERLDALDAALQEAGRGSGPPWTRSSPHGRGARRSQSSPGVDAASPPRSRGFGAHGAARNEGRRRDRLRRRRPARSAWPAMRGLTTASSGTGSTSSPIASTRSPPAPSRTARSSRLCGARLTELGEAIDQLRFRPTIGAGGGRGAGVAAARSRGGATRRSSQPSTSCPGGRRSWPGVWLSIRRVVEEIRSGCRGRGAERRGGSHASPRCWGGGGGLARA